MLQRLSKCCARTEKRLAIQRVDQRVVQSLQLIGRDVIDAELHPAGDVHADRVGNDRVLRRQNAADGQAISLMRIGHQRAADRYGKSHRRCHLIERALFQSLAPDSIRRGSIPLDPVGAIAFLDQFRGEIAEEGVGCERLGLRQNFLEGLIQFGATLRLIARFAIRSAKPTSGPSR